jgi:hypothetical protein
VSLVPHRQIRATAAEETDRLRQWGSRLSDAARDAFLADPDGPIPDDYLDEVMAGGIRVIGIQRGNVSMEWSFPPQTRQFIKGQTG